MYIDAIVIPNALVYCSSRHTSPVRLDFWLGSLVQHAWSHSLGGFSIFLLAPIAPTVWGAAVTKYPKLDLAPMLANRCCVQAVFAEVCRITKTVAWTPIRLNNLNLGGKCPSKPLEAQREL